MKADDVASFTVAEHWFHVMVFVLPGEVADRGLIRCHSGLGRGIGKYEVMRVGLATFVTETGTVRPVAGP